MYLIRYTVLAFIFWANILSAQGELLSSNEESSNLKTISFDIHFRKSHAEPKHKDIARKLDYNIPDMHVVKKVMINAYSSFEGDSMVNKMLREQRAENIARMLKAILKSDYDIEVNSSDSWQFFSRDVKNNDKYKYLKDWSKSQIYNYLQEEPNKLELEPVLKNHRFVSVKILLQKSDVSQDIEYLESNVKQELVSESEGYINTSNKTSTNYIYLDKSSGITQVQLDSFFNEVLEVLDERLSDLEEKSAGVVSNIKKQESFKKSDNTEYYRTKRAYIEGKLDIIDESEDSKMIDRVRLLKKLANINSFYLGDSTQISYEEIKRLYQLDEMSSRQGLRVAQLAYENKDYKYAYKILDHYIVEENKNVEYLLTMIYCAEALLFKGDIANEMKYIFKKLWQNYPESFCALFLDKSLNLLPIYTAKISKQKCKLCIGYDFNCD